MPGSASRCSGQSSMTIDLETARFILSPAGERLLKDAQLLTGDLLTKLTDLRKRYPPDVSSAALEMIELRDRAARKFSFAEEMFFVREALEQSSGETISRYRADRFPAGATVLDLGCGIGGDTIALASRGSVIAVDHDPVRLMMAERNLQVYGLAERVRFVHAEMTQIELRGDAAFLDPSRRQGRHRSRHIADINPPLEFVLRLIQEIPDCAVKLSPATPDEELVFLDGEHEFISDRGECKEAVIWLGRFRTCERRATLLPQCATMVDKAVDSVPVKRPGRYLIEPDACIVRAHLVEQFAHDIGAWKLAEQIAYLSSDKIIPTLFGECYEILQSMPFVPKLVNRRLRELDAGKIIVKKRGVPFDPQEVERGMKLGGSRELILILTRIRGKAWALITRALHA